MRFHYLFYNFTYPYNIIPWAHYKYQIRVQAKKLFISCLNSLCLFLIIFDTLNYVLVFHPDLYLFHYEYVEIIVNCKNTSSYMKYVNSKYIIVLCLQLNYLDFR